MGKRRKSNSNGLLDKLFRPWKTNRVTLTPPGEKQAPMRKGKKKTVKKVKKIAAPLSVKEKQAKELQAMYRIGKQDPERLAQIISSMLAEAFMEEQDSKLKFERLLWEKVEKGNGQAESSDEEGGSSGSPRQE